MIVGVILENNIAGNQNCYYLTVYKYLKYPDYII